jgi:hypothetical protein
MSEATVTPRPIRRTSIATNVVLQVLAGVLLLGVVNYLSFRHFRRWDLTRDRQFTLTPQTQGFLKSIRGKTDVIAVFPKGGEEEKEIRALLEEYKRTGRARVEVDYLDLNREPSRRLEMEKKYSLSINQNGLIVSKQAAPPKSRPAGADPAAPVPPARRTRFVSAAQIFTYDEEGPQRRLTEFRGEDLLTSALIGVNQKTPPVIYVLTGNIGNLPAARGPGGQTISAQNVLWDMASKQDAHVRTLGLTGLAEIPADATAIVSIRPGLDFSQREIELLDAWWTTRKGAGLFFLLDPETEMPRLDAFLARYGVRPRPDRVLKVLTTAQGTRKELEVPAAFNPDAAVTAPLGGSAITFPEQSKTLRLEEDSRVLRAAALQVTPLAFASADYWGESRPDDPAPRRDEADTGAPDPLILAASVERGAQQDQRLSAAASRLVVVGNAALIDPDRETTRVNPVAYDFVSSSLSWLLDREELIGIASRRLPGYHLDLAPGHTAKILGLCLGLLPAAVLTLLIAVWSARRA